MKKYLKYLFLLLVPCIIILTIIFDKDHEMIYIPLSISVSSLIVFILFPQLVLGLHARPIYYEDLIIKDFSNDDVEVYDKNFRKKYQLIFRYLVTITSTIMIFIASEVWFLKTEFTMGNNNNSSNPSSGASLISPDYAIAFGIIGGILKIYFSLSTLIGKILLMVLKKIKRRIIKKMRQKVTNMTEAELGNAGITIGKTNTMSMPLRSKSLNNLNILDVAPSAKMNDIFSHINDYET